MDRKLKTVKHLGPSLASMPAQPGWSCHTSDRHTGCDQACAHNIQIQAGNRHDHGAAHPPQSVAARNASAKMSRRSMPWTVQHDAAAPKHTWEDRMHGHGDQLWHSHLQHAHLSNSSQHRG